MPSRLDEFAAVVGIALMALWAMLQLVLDLLDEWESASALSLNTRSCLEVAVGDRREAEAMVRPLPRHGAINAVRRAMPLGVRLGPDASSGQWNEVVAKVHNRF